MKTTLDMPKNINIPHVMDVTSNYIIVYKPPRMHSAPGKGESVTLWCAERFPEIFSVSSRRAGEGSLIHRLDYETQGLLLFARTQNAYDKLLEQQEQNRFVKEYFAASYIEEDGLAAFPPPQNIMPLTIDENEPYTIESFFRPFGQGRKQVRPVVMGNNAACYKDIAGDKGQPYRTLVIEKRIHDCQSFQSKEPLWYFKIRLTRGFRHQIRCHLAWYGFPILNDPVYSRRNPDGIMALQAGTLSFDDPEDGQRLHFCLPEIPTEINF